MDQTVKRIRPKDFELSTVQDNLGNCIDQLLAASQTPASPSPLILSPKLQQLRGSGTPYSIQSPALQINGDPQNTGGTTVLIGTPATATAAQLNANTAIYGNVAVNGLTSFNGNVTVNAPLTANGGVTSQGIIQAQTFNSLSGFKSFVPCGTHYRVSGTGGIVRAIDICYQSTGTIGSIPANRPMPYAGSIVGLFIHVGYSASTQSISLQVYKNNQTGITGQMIDTAAVPSGGTIPASPIVFNKGVYPFAANDTLGMGVYTSNNTAFACSVGLIVEMGA